MSATAAPVLSIRDRILAFDHAMTADDIAKLFGVHVDNIYKKARRGDIPSFRIDTSLRFDPKEVAEWYGRK